jgi:uncharacterized membrane-anchored protein
MMDRVGWRNGLLAATFLLQIGLLISMIAGAERTIDEGRIWMFRTAPVDPVDLFRGRYATLSFPIVSVPIVEGDVTLGDRVYVSLETDEDGFGRFAEVSTSRPESPDHLEVEVLGVSGRRARVQLPYDRFYMDEARAPEVDQLMRRGVREAWAIVRVHEGRGVVVDLHVEESTAADDFAASSLIVWPAGTPVPDAIVERIRADVGEWQLAECQRTQDCLLAAVDLDDAVEPEFVFVAAQPRGAGRIFHIARREEGEGPDAWRLQAMQYEGGRVPRTTQEIVDALEATDGRGVAPLRRVLRLGDARLRVPG